MPGFRGLGLGRELLRTSAAALYGSGAHRVSLTVTAVNRLAVSIYEKFGFDIVRSFFAYIWEA
jgi:ribosomal protein S18 acetylase RimI-like enzyme